MRGKAKKYLEYGKIGSNNRQNSNKKDIYFTLIKCTIHRETVAVI